MGLVEDGVPGEVGRPADPVSSEVPDLDSTDDRTIIDLRGFGPFLSLGRYRYLTAQGALPAQKHSNMLVLAVPLRSRFDFVIDGRVVHVEPGQVIRIRPGRAYTTGIGAQSRGELVWLLVQSRPSARAVDDPLLDLIADLVREEIDVQRASEFAIDLLIAALEKPADTTRLTLAWRQSLCTSALLEIARRTRQDRASIPIHPGLLRAAAWIEEHIDESIAVAQLVDVAGMSTTHFYQQFARAFGTSPKDYVLRAKITQAEHALITRPESVSEIAHTLGFSTSQHFGTAFRRYTGMSPTQYRALRRSLPAHVPTAAFEPTADSDSGTPAPR